MVWGSTVTVCRQAAQMGKLFQKLRQNSHYMFFICQLLLTLFYYFKKKYGKEVGIPGDAGWHEVSPASHVIQLNDSRASALKTRSHKRCNCRCKSKQNKWSQTQVQEKRKVSAFAFLVWKGHKALNHGSLRHWLAFGLTILSLASLCRYSPPLLSLD